METEENFVFTLEGEEPTVPAQAIKVKVGETVKITFKNNGKVPHVLAVVAEPERDALVLFDASIGSPTQPILPGESSTIIFQAITPGRFSYACTVPGHIELGMHGNFIVEE